jgi:hypothetical protein
MAIWYQSPDFVSTARLMALTMAPARLFLTEAEWLTSGDPTACCSTCAAAPATAS